MENQSVFDPKMGSKGAGGDPAPLTGLPNATHLKKSVRFVEADMFHLSSAFLAERGCLSTGQSRKQNAA
jgi:hypothetical protein